LIFWSFIAFHCRIQQRSLWNKHVTVIDVLVSWFCRTFFGKIHLVKKSADLQPKQSNSLRRNTFTGAYMTSLRYKI
jgi:hypothetical protein